MYLYLNSEVDFASVLQLNHVHTSQNTRLLVFFLKKITQHNVNAHNMHVHSPQPYPL
jgi:hypothetical protein